MDVKIGASGQVRGNSPRLPGEGNLINVETNPRGELVATLGLPEGVEQVRLGEAFYAIQGTGVVALDDALPTTVAGTTIWNGNGANGKSLIVTHAGAICTTSAGAATSWKFFIEPSIVTSAAVLTTADTGVCRSFLTGLTYPGGALLSKTVTVTDNGWINVGDATGAEIVTGTIGQTVGGKLPVPFIVRPGYYLATATVAVNATMAGKGWFIFYEVQLPTV